MYDLNLVHLKAMARTSFKIGDQYKISIWGHLFYYFVPFAHIMNLTQKMTPKFLLMRFSDGMYVIS